MRGRCASGAIHANRNSRGPVDRTTRNDRIAAVQAPSPESTYTAKTSRVQPSLLTFLSRTIDSHSSTSDNQRCLSICVHSLTLLQRLDTDIMSPLGFAAAFGPVSAPTHSASHAVSSRRPASAIRRAPVAVMDSPRQSTYATNQKQTCTVKVMENNRCTIIEVDRETDLRRALLAEKIDLYTLGGKFTNCGGGGQCGTCVVAVEDGVYSTSGRTPKEEFLLKGKPANFRLACRTMVHGDCTIRMKPKA
jgi:ferredoxin